MEELLARFVFRGLGGGLRFEEELARFEEEVRVTGGGRDVAGASSSSLDSSDESCEPSDSSSSEELSSTSSTCRAGRLLLVFVLVSPWGSEPGCVGGMSPSSWCLVEAGKG